MARSLQTVVAALVALSAFSGSARAAEPSGFTLRANSAWSASLYVRPGQALPELDGARLGPPSTVGARLTGKLSKHSRLSLEVANVLDRQPGEVDRFALSRQFTPAADGLSPNPVESRAFTIRLRTTF